MQAVLVAPQQAPAVAVVLVALAHLIPLVGLAVVLEAPHQDLLLALVC